MKQKKAYQYRMYPTQEQAHIFARTFGCCRYVYNWALRARTDAFFQRGERLYYHQLAVILTDLKKQDETAWLSEVSSVPPMPLTPLHGTAHNLPLPRWMPRWISTGRARCPKAVNPRV